MSIKHFFNKIVSQGYIDRGESFEGTSNLDKDFSEYIKKLFRPWNLLHTLQSSNSMSLNSYLKVVCYKTKEYLIEREDILIERDSDISGIEYPYSFENYDPYDFAIFARDNGKTKFLGIYVVDSQISVATNKLTYKLISNRLYIDYSDDSGLVYMGRFKGMNADASVAEDSAIMQYAVTYIPVITADLNLGDSKKYVAIIDLHSHEYEELCNYLEEKDKRPHIKAPYIEAVVARKIAKQVEATTGNPKNYILKCITKLNE